MKKTVRGALFFLLMALVGAAAGYWLGNSPTAANLLAVMGEMPWWVSVLLMITAVFLTLTLHELGHLVAGLAQGFSFAMLAVGPLLVRKENGRIRPALNRSPSTYGGLAATMPPTDEPELLKKMALVVAAGPLTTLLFTLLFALLFFILPLDGQMRFFLFLMTLFGVAIFFATTIPEGGGGFLTDRARWQMLRRGGAEAQRWAAVAQLTSLSQQGTRPSQWSSALVDQAIGLSDGSTDALLGHLFAYYAYLDRGEIAKAGEQLTLAANGVESLPAIARPSVYVELAYFTAAHQQDAPAAHRWLDQAKGSVVEKWTRVRAETAVLTAEGQGKTAVAQLDSAIAAAKAAQSNGVAIAEADWMQQLKNAIVMDSEQSN